MDNKSRTGPHWKTQHNPSSLFILTLSLQLTNNVTILSAHHFDVELGVLRIHAITSLILSRTLDSRGSASYG